MNRQAIFRVRESYVAVAMGNAVVQSILEETKRQGRRLLRLAPRPGFWERISLRRRRDGYVSQKVRVTMPAGGVYDTYCLIAFWRSDDQMEASFQQDIAPEMVPPGTTIEIVESAFVPYSVLDGLPDRRTREMKRATCDPSLHWEG